MNHADGSERGLNIAFSEALAGDGAPSSICSAAAPAAYYCAVVVRTCEPRHKETSISIYYMTVLWLAGTPAIVGHAIGAIGKLIPVYRCIWLQY